MPSNTNTDKEIDNLEQASEPDKKFIAFKKRMFRLGVGFLIAAIVLSLPIYFFLETSNNILGTVIFLFVVLADIFILLPAIITKETNWPALLGSTILCIVFLCLSVFYPFQDFQYRLKVVSLVAIVATLLFVLLNSWINAAFFPSKNANIRQSVDFVSNRFAVDVLNVTLILGTLFGTIAFLYFYPDKDNSAFFGGIDIKNVALATAGLVTFFWAAKATKNKSIDLEQKKKEFEQRKQEFEEKKRDGKRHDNEIAMAKRRDTAQLIAEASKLLSSKNVSQKYGGLSLLNTVAGDREGPFGKEAFDLIADFILSNYNISMANKTRMRAIRYADDLVGNNPDKFQINEFIQISSSVDTRKLFDKSVENYFSIQNLHTTFIRFSLNKDFVFDVIQSKRPRCLGFVDCDIFGNPNNLPLEIDKISAYNCRFHYFKIKKINSWDDVQIRDILTGVNLDRVVFPDEKKFRRKGYVNKFYQCDFSDSLMNDIIKDSVPNGQQVLENKFTNCFYYAGHKPAYFDEKRYGDLLTEITSEQQFYQKFKDFPYMHYSPPDDKK